MIRKIIISLLLLTALPVLAMPPGGSDEKRAKYQKQHAEKMAQVLNLRKDQIAKVEEIMQAQKEAKTALYKKSAKQRKALQDETVKKLSTVLNENQLGRYEAFTEGMRLSKQHKSSKGRMH
ncbi:hypothetical protein ACFL3U_05235 [Pseudomonadota bacterium]